MSAITWEKIDKFYVILVVILILMALLVTLSVRSIFSAYLETYEIDQTSLRGEIRVKTEELDKAYDWVFSRLTTPLNLIE